mmetsp:Transcript_14186/g.57157  ORF Transcript_14186/g.57157 Transcript_14186/m.57157 type:complete len:117 (+) Transcript_14186:1415-1765(+)
MKRALMAKVMLLRSAKSEVMPCSTPSVLQMTCVLWFLAHRGKQNKAKRVEYATHRGSMVKLCRSKLINNFLVFWHHSWSIGITFRNVPRIQARQGDFQGRRRSQARSVRSSVRALL